MLYFVMSFRRQGDRCVFTEFTNTTSYCHPDGLDNVRSRLAFTEDEQPIVAHIWGQP